MCLISTEIQQVSKTKILVAPNSDNTRQLVVYSNYVNNVSNSNAMVLPVPLPHTIKFIDLSKYKRSKKTRAPLRVPTSIVNANIIRINTLQRTQIIN